MPDFPMPAFRDEGDPAYTWVWDGHSHSYIQIPSEEADHPDRSHSTGGDNALFDPAVHTEKAGNPLQEGILASVKTGAGDDLFARLDQINQGQNPALALGRATAVMAFDPDKRAEAEQVYNEWGVNSLFVQGWNSALEWAGHPLMPPETRQMYRQEFDQLRQELSGNHQASFDSHECQRCGSPLNTDGLCTICDRGNFSDTAPMNTRTIPFPDRAPKPNSDTTDISFPSMTAHVKVTTNHEIGKFVIDMDGNMHYEPGGNADTTRIRTRDHITSPGAEGTVFADGVGQITMIHPGFVPEEEAISEQLADAFGEGCMLEPVSEHLKLDNGHPVKGDMSQEFQTFAHVDEERAFLASNPETLSNCPDCNDVMVPGPREATCHSCGHRQPVIYTVAGQMLIAGPELLALAPVAEELGGEAASALGGGGDLAGASEAGPGGIGGIMRGALGMGRNQMAMQGLKGMMGGGTQPNGDMPSGPGAPNEAVITHLLSAGVIESAFGDEEVGMAVKNRGDDHNPAEKGTQGFNEEHGDASELLKDVDGVGGASEGDEATQGHEQKLKADAMKAFHLNLPLILEFCESDEAGIDNPILKALDDLLEQAFPGYKGDGEGDATHSPENQDPASEVVVEDAEEPSNESEHEEGTGDKEKHKEGSNVPVEHLGWSLEQPSVPPNGLPGAVPGSVPPGVPPGAPGGIQQPIQPPQNGVQEQPCPMCGYPHPPGTPCGGGTNMQQPPQTQSIASFWSIAEETSPEHGHHHPTDGSGDTSDKDHGHGSHPGHDWVDESGQPLQEGQTYEMISPNYAVPDEVVIDRILPDKLIYTVRTDLMDYQDEMTKEDLANEGYTFSQAMQAPDSTDGFDAPQEHPIRPGQDGAPQVDDLSQQSTTVSRHEPELDAKLGWLMDEESSPVDVDPELYASLMGQPTTAASTGSRRLPEGRYAGRDYTPREQREFIDEPGVARNLDNLDLSGTHYPDEDDVDAHFLW